MYREFRFVRPHRVHRSPEETVAVWRRRTRSFAFATVGWLAVALIAELSDEATFSLVSLAAAVASAVAVVKGLILIRRNSRPLA